MSRRTYPAYPSNPAIPGHSGAAQPTSNYPGQSHQNVAGYPSQNVAGSGYPVQQYPGQPVGNYSLQPTQNMQQTTRPAGSAVPPPLPGQSYYGQSNQNISGVPPPALLTSRMQQMQLGPQGMLMCTWCMIN